MTQEEWDTICKVSSIKMIEHVINFSTPISLVESDGAGRHHGSGSYFEIECERYLITNDHVAKELDSAPLTHLFYEDVENRIISLTNPAISLKAPIDVAICKIDNSIWNSFEHKAKAIPFDRFSSSHHTVENELLFFAGYSGERSNFCFGYLNTPGTPYLTQEAEFPTSVKEANPEHHFSLFYNPEKAISVDGRSSLPDPHGFSGSLVWDTKIVACMQKNIEWKPELATVTGIVWGWPSSSAMILCTKVEYFNLSFLKDKLKELET